MSDAPSSGPTRPVPRPAPNYAARRMLVSTVAATVVVVLAVVGWRLVRGDGDGSVGAPGEWDRIALVDRTSGAVTYVDDDGEVTGTSVGAGRVNEVHVHGDRLVLVGPELVVLLGADDDAVTIPVQRGSTVTPVVTDSTFHLLVGRPTGGDVVILDATDGATTDVGAMAEQTDPLIFVETMRHAPDGSAFAFADAANFQTILVRTGFADPTFFPDQPVAVGDDLIATSQVVGRDADIVLSSWDREIRASGTIGIPAGGAIADDRLVVVSVDGAVFRLGRDDEQAEQIGDLAVPTGSTVRWVRPSLDGERLVVAGTVFEAVIDLDGTTVFTTTFTAPVELPAPDPRWVCLPVGADTTYHSLIALETGEQLADLTGLEVTGASSDGCTVIGTRSGVTEVIGVEGSIRLGQVRSAHLGPDGRTAVVQRTNGRTELLRIGDDLALEDPTDLGAAAPSNLAVAFLDD